MLPIYKEGPSQAKKLPQRDREEDRTLSFRADGNKIHFISLGAHAIWSIAK